MLDLYFTSVEMFLIIILENSIFMFFVVVVDAVFGLPTTPFETQAANVQGVMTIYH